MGWRRNWTTTTRRKSTPSSFVFFLLLLLKRSDFSSGTSKNALLFDRPRLRRERERSTRTNVLFCVKVRRFKVRERGGFLGCFFSRFFFFLLFFCSGGLLSFSCRLSLTVTVFVKTSSIMREPLTKTKTKKKEALRRATLEKDDGKQTDFSVKERIETATMEVLGKRGLEKTC